MKYTLFPNTEKIDFSKKLRVKFGIDPTSDKLHLGHLIPLRLAKKLWDEGHSIDIVLGTFTARLGDPSGKDTMRPVLGSEVTEKNAQSIISQVARIFGDIDSSHSGFNRIKIHRNAEWFSKISAIELADILSNFTTTQLLLRDSFQKRIEAKNPIGMHELIVPILQGFDSVKLQSDVEIGGTDQMFNFAISRDMQRLYGQTPEVCILMPIINGTDGRKMSKSFENCIFINDTPEDVFGKTMSISDSLMKEWWPIITETIFPTDPKGDCHPNDMHPMQLKKDLAFFITSIIWDNQKAVKAQENFENIIQGKKIPENIMEIASIIDNRPITITEVVMKIRSCSKSEALRLLDGGAVSVDGVKISPDFPMFRKDLIIKVGKRDFAKLV